MRQVKLILVEGVHSLGEAGDLVSVKPGYARNYLVPQGKAIHATDSRVRELEHNQRIVAEKAAKEMKDLGATKQQLEKLELQIGARAGEEGKLFGSVTSAQIAELLAEKGFTLDRRRIDTEPLKSVGTHEIPVKLHRDVVATVKLEVIAEGAPEPARDDDDEDDDDRDRRRGRGRDRDDDDDDDDDDD